MQLVRQIEVGIDVDGDGSADLNAQRIYYAGQSFGGIYGTIVLGIEPQHQGRRAQRGRSARLPRSRAWARSSVALARRHARRCARRR